MNPIPTSIGQRLVQHALDCHPIPVQARRSARIFLEDSLFVGLAGVNADGRRELVEAAANWDQGGSVRLWGDGRTCSAATAALINGFQIHCQEFDCVHEPAVVHPMAVIAASLLSWSETQPAVSGRALLDAVVVSVDVAATLGMMATRPMRFFRPAMCGALGATLGLCRLAGLDPVSSRRALGLAWCQLSGNMQSHVEGSSGLALQIGFNARAAVCAIDLAMAGLAGPEDSIDGPFGYLELIEQEFDTSPIGDLGRIFRIEQVSHKPWPTGRAAHGTLDALERLLEAGLESKRIERITLKAPALIRRLIDRPAKPGMTAQYARLCLPWLVSVTLARGRVGLTDFTGDALADQERAAFTDRVIIEPDDNPDPNALTPQEIIVHTDDGRAHHHRTEHVRGCPQNPLDEYRKNQKVHACARFAGLSEAGTRKLLTALQHVEATEDVGSISALMRPESGGDEPGNGFFNLDEDTENE